jgi:hypothetical protein
VIHWVGYFFLPEWLHHLCCPLQTQGILLATRWLSLLYNRRHNYMAVRVDVAGFNFIHCDWHRKEMCLYVGTIICHLILQIWNIKIYRGAWILQFCLKASVQVVLFSPQKSASLPVDKCFRKWIYSFEYRLHSFDIQWRPLIIIADNVINRLLLSKSVVPKHSI